MAMVLSFIRTVMESSTSILFAAFGVLIMQLAGVLNIGAEGMMLVGAFFGVLGSSLSGSALVGTLMAILAAGVTGVLFGYCTVVKKANQVVVGIAFNLLASGLTTTMYRHIFGMKSSSTKVASYVNVGPVSMPVYLGIACVFIITVFLYKTKYGLKIRGVGEYPQAIDTFGLSVDKIRFISVIVGSMLIGAGGAYLSLGQLSFFTEDMVTGRGYIALAAVIFGRYTPLGTWLAVLVFGTGEAMVYRFQAAGSGVPTQLILMIPYLLTVIVVAIFGQKGEGPASLGVPFLKNAKE